jgi:hypothetical protein
LELHRGVAAEHARPVQWLRQIGNPEGQRSS